MNADPPRDQNIVMICDRLATFRIDSLGAGQDYDRRQPGRVYPAWTFFEHQSVIQRMNAARIANERVCVIVIDMYFQNNADEQFGAQTVGDAQRDVLTEAVQHNLPVFEVTSQTHDTVAAIHAPLAGYAHHTLIRKVANNMFSGGADHDAVALIQGNFDVAVVMGFDADTCVKAAIFCTPGLLNLGISVISSHKVLATGGGFLNDINYYRLDN